MFDDPKKALRKMEEALWEAEAGEWEEPDAPEEPLPEDTFSYSDDSDWLREARELIGEEQEERPAREEPLPRRRRNDAVDFHRTVYADEEMDENSAVFVEKRKKKGKKSSGCLPIVILLELIGIAGVVWWWVRWLS